MVCCTELGSALFLNVQELSDDDVEAMLQMNISSTCWMTRAVLPKMIKNKRGCIVNISSGAARLKNPLLALYSGTKVSNCVV
jgi:short-subunit dehydrogenase